MVREIVMAMVVYSNPWRQTIMTLLMNVNGIEWMNVLEGNKGSLKVVRDGIWCN